MDAPAGPEKPPKIVNQGLNAKSFGVRDFRSFSDVVGARNSGGDGGSGSGSYSGPGSQVVEKSVVVPDRLVAFEDLRGLAVVGRTVDLETLVDFDKLLRIARISFDKIQYLGGLSLFISFWNKEEAVSFLNSRKVWEPWFSKVDIWDGQSLPMERVAWLKVSGVPLHLFEPGVMESVGSLFGKVLHVLKSLTEEKDLSVTRVAVLAGEATRIREVVKIVWKERVYRVWIEEEQEDWVPDCIGPLRVSSELDSPVRSGDVESPMASSPVVEVTKVNGQRGGIEGNEESCMEGDVGGSQEAAGVGPERSEGLGNAFNYDTFMDCGSGSASQPVGKKGFFVFNSRKKSKRQRRGGSKYQGSCESPLFNLDSNEKTRPTKRKRNKAHIEEDSDPFSLEKILDPVNGMNVRGNGDGDAISGFSGGNSANGRRVWEVKE
ncbi:hypothetical protein HanPI659440_Chr03g0100971 [Helianthus annuus]|nr:hypothetical protein HanPI659440_Chr03g0100971 [Helianthus annuus]